MTATCLQKQDRIKALFEQCPDEDAKYRLIIELGRKQKPLDQQFKIPENLVKGCQSTMYLHADFTNGVMIFTAESDALISSGLAALLIDVYSGETPETILKCAPTYLETLGVSSSLTPNRANGLYSIHLKMKQEALKALVNPKK